MGTAQRPAPSSTRGSMRPPPRPTNTQQSSAIGRAPSPAESSTSSNAPVAGVKRKERDFENEGGEETNIHVVVRCRGRSDREVRENSGVVVSANGVKGKTVELSMGPNAISNKTYQFDKVFSPAADQAIIYEDVVAPVLNEMLGGYNCTIFAYGQTGTGKTYTMSGDMTDTFGLLSDAAGIIPRVLYSLFQRLESDDTECSVKCSFIELYNEELRDLLSPEENVKLKIYDDANKKSHTATLVQGMEESHIKSASAGIKLLQEGSFRRQVAATKCNDLSSRSHTVFTVTTYIKKTTESGEDYICSGKLNLVDLAGSENIQRSGAENKRAAEAGLINKSLLTLGRVINALVDKSSHIPYRESKLTRLLQDSLGGRTKTCIIATVSPAKSNLEETISTLDYAFRAKNIRNKPQMNTMISKKTLLREFTTEIEKLKSELIATRQRNGVYLTNDQFEEITVESESRRILSEEQKSRIETMEISLRNKVQELFNLINNFTQLKRDNESTRTAWENTKDILQKTEIVLAHTKQTLIEETAIREAHEATEQKLANVGTGLISTLNESIKDVDALHAKLRRRSDLHSSNQNLWISSTSRLDNLSSVFDSKISDFEQAYTSLVASTATRIRLFVESESQKLDQSSALLDVKANEIGERENHAEMESSNARTTMNNALEEIKSLRETVKDQVRQGLQGLSQAAAKISGEVITELEYFHTQLHTSYSGLGKDLKATFDDICNQLETQRQESADLKVVVEEANSRALNAWTEASTQLDTFIAAEHSSAMEERDNLKSQILALIDASSANQEQRLDSFRDGIQDHIIKSKKSVQETNSKYRQSMERWTGQDGIMMAKLAKSKDDLKSRIKHDWTAIEARNLSIQTSTKSVHEETVRIVDAQLKEMAVQMEALDDFVTRARQQNDEHHKEQAQASKMASVHISETLGALKQEITERASTIKTFGNQTKENSKELNNIVNIFATGTRSSLQNLQAEISKTNMVEYVPTGNTPQRKDWSYPTELPRTEDHQIMLSRLRGHSDQVPAAKTPSVTRALSRSPKKQTSPRKTVSPSKMPSPKKGKIYTDIGNGGSNTTIDSHAHPGSNGIDSFQSLKEVNTNVLTRSISSTEIEAQPLFSKSVGSGQPPLKRHATANIILDGRVPNKQGKYKAMNGAPISLGVENLSQSLGTGRRLRSSPSG